MAETVHLRATEASPLGGEAAVPDREASYTEPASHLQPDDAVNVDFDKDGSSESGEQPVVHDIFKPLPPLKGVAEERSPLTVRAVVVGVALGTLVNAANVYLGLKTGFTFSSNMFGAIFGYGIIKLFSVTCAGMPVLGMPFGPQENSIVQAAAVGAGGLSGLFVAALPAMYRLNLTTMSFNPSDDFGKFLTLTFIGSFFGLFFAVPLRSFFIINVARELRLIFPSPTAVAFTIRSMHDVGSGQREATLKIKALGIAFVASLVLRVVSTYAIGILWDWHLFTWFFIWGNYSNYAITIESWGWWIEWTPAFIGSGMLVGIPVGISYFVGSFLAWGVIGPILVHVGTCVGKDASGGDPNWAGYTNYLSLRGMDRADYVPSPRYWLLWPGVMILVCYSMAEFAFHWKVLWIGIRYGWTTVATAVNGQLVKRGKSSPFFAKHAGRDADESGLVEDFATKDMQVPTWIWTSGVVAILAITIIIFEVQWDINGGLGILASILGIMFAYMAIHSSGVTDVTPLTAAAKASQLVFGGVTHGQERNRAMTTNLIAGAIASAGADMSNALVSDFRTGFLLRTPPKLQFYAQAFGTFVAMFVAPAIFLLFAKAYPCVVHLAPEDSVEVCQFPAPSVAAWQAVAEAVTLPNIPIPLSSGIFALVMGGLAVVQVAVQRRFLTGKRDKYRQFLPNWMAIGVAFVIPATQYSTAMLMGSVVSWYLAKKNLKSWDRYCYAVAAGMIAGEGLGGVVQAALEVGNVGSAYASAVACPAGACP